MEIKNILEKRIEAYNALKADPTSSGTALKLAEDDIKASATTAKSDYTDAAINRFLDMGEAEMMKEFMLNRSYEYPAADKDKDSGRYTLVVKKDKVYWPALDDAYWERNKKHYHTRTGFPKMLHIIRYNAQKLAQQSHKGTTDGVAYELKEHKIPELKKEHKEFWETLKKEDARWGKASKSALAFQFEEFRKAIAPEGMEPPAYLRNSDRYSFAVKVNKITNKELKDGSHRDYYATFTTNKLFDLYFDTLNMAYMNWDYEEDKPGVSGNSQSGGQSGDNSAEEKPNNTGDTASERKAPDENSAMAEAARKNAKPVEEEPTVVADNSKEIERAMESCGFTKPAETAAEQADNGESK